MTFFPEFQNCNTEKIIMILVMVHYKYQFLEKCKFVCFFIQLVNSKTKPITVHKAIVSADTVQTKGTNC